MSNFSPFLGKGARYPFAFNEITGGVEKASSESYYLGDPAVDNKDLEKINGSIHNILSTALYTRFFLQTFGSKINSLVFEPNDDIFADTMRVYVAEALGRWEKRIILLSVDIVTDNTDFDNHTAKIVINYRIISSQRTGNYVYPFVRGI